MKRGGNPQNLTNRNGRPKGTKNKFTNLKAAFLNVFKDLQDDKDANLSAFAKKHPRDFYVLVSKMLPTKNEDDGLAKALRHIIVVRNSGEKKNDDDAK